MKKTDRVAQSCRILGLGPDATLRDLKRVFHKKAVEYHPDVNPSAAAAAEFKIITAAYGILKQHLRNHPPAPPEPIQKKRTRKMRERDARVDEEARRVIFHRPRRTAQQGPRPAAGPLLPAPDLIYRLENSSNKYVRLHAVRALAELGGPDAAWPVIQALYDHDPDVRLHAVHALGNMRARFAVMPLIRLHESAENQVAAAAVLAALEKIGSPLALKFLADQQPAPAQEHTAQQAPDIA